MKFFSSPSGHSFGRIAFLAIAGFLPVMTGFGLARAGGDWRYGRHHSDGYGGDFSLICEKTTDEREPMLAAFQTYLGHSLRLDDVQREGLGQLVSLSGVELAKLKATCGRSLAELPFMEKVEIWEERLTIAHESLRAIKPELVAFYSSLNKEQQMELDELLDSKRRHERR